MASVQYGSITVVQPATSATAMITSVDTTRAVVIPLGATTTNNVASWYVAENMGDVALTNATTVTARRAGGGSYDLTINFMVIEFSVGSVKSIQNVVIAGADDTTSNTLTITSVDTTKTAIFVRNPRVQNADIPNFPGTPAQAEYRVTLTNATTLTQTRNTTATNRGNTSVTVVEFK